MDRLDHKVAFITGIGSGIGRAAATLFVQQGATVFGVDYSQDLGQAVAAELQQVGKFQFFQADLAKQADCVGAIAHCQAQHGRIDILYNNAGISVVEPFEQTTPATLERILAVNFTSVFYLCQQVLPLMQQQQSGVIINTASELAIVAQPGYAAYCASKGAVLAFTRALALECAQTNIRVNALCPGPIETPMLQQEFDTDADPVRAKQEAIASMPIGRLGTPAEIAQVALYLASDAPRLMHGAAVVVDGAKTIF